MDCACLHFETSSWLPCFSPSRTDLYPPSLHARNRQQRSPSDSHSFHLLPRQRWSRRHSLRQTKRVAAIHSLSHLLSSTFRACHQVLTASETAFLDKPPTNIKLHHFTKCSRSISNPHTTQWHLTPTVTLSTSATHTTTSRCRTALSGISRRRHPRSMHMTISRCRPVLLDISRRRRRR